VVAATNRDLEQMMLRGEFREDLYYRLKVIEASVPSLRERRDEIPSLTDFFIAKYSQRYNRPVRPLTPELRERFLGYDWPGNVRELENMIKRFVILQDEQLVTRELTRPRPVAMPGAMPAATDYANVAPPAFHSPTAPPISPPVSPEAPNAADAGSDSTESASTRPPSQAHDGRRLADVAREAALSAERTVIAATLRQVHWNRRKAAQILGVSYKTLLNKIKETGIERP
jgi:DNA-binding NtrC family response regulator